jgi:hypothetical protein
MKLNIKQKVILSLFVLFIISLIFVSFKPNNTPSKLNQHLITEEDIIGKTKLEMWQILKLKNSKTEHKTSYVRALGNNLSYAEKLKDNPPLPEQHALATSWRWHGPWHHYYIYFNEEGIVSSLDIENLP